MVVKLYFITNILNWLLINSDVFSCHIIPPGSTVSFIQNRHEIYETSLVKLFRIAYFLAWPKPNESEFPEGKVWTCEFWTCDDLMPHGCHGSKCFTLPWHFIPFRRNQVKTIWWVSIKFQYLLQFFSARRLNLSELAGSRSIYEWANPIVLIYGAITETWSCGMDVWPLGTAQGLWKVRESFQRAVGTWSQKPKCTLFKQFPCSKPGDNWQDVYLLWVSISTFLH